ncbi:hypothetical protein ACHJH3_06880 [Campylobacter sp. MOP7]|uniref:ATP-dependent DNA ligase n=1 Tax=Campylobacter canis TaxID=3378588 RepID=UPI00387E350E
MNIITKLYTDINTLRNISSRKEKEAYLKSLVDYEPFSELVLMTYDLSKNYFYQRAVVNQINDDAPEPYWKKIVETLNKISSEKIQGHLNRDMILSLTNSEYPEAGALLQLILDRDLACGVGISTFNKIFNNLIPIHAIMKAESITPDDLAKIKFPVYVENKYDGCRCAAKVNLNSNEVNFVTSNGNYIDMPNMAEQIKHFIKNNHGMLEKYAKGGMVDLDGEIVADTRTNTSAIMTKFVRNTASAFDDLDLNYHIWDILPSGSIIGTFTNNSGGKKRLQITDIPLHERISFLGSLDFSSDRIFRAEGKIAHSIDEVMDFFSTKIAEINGEGIIIKTLDGFYERGNAHRSKEWMKLKKRNEADLIVVDVELSDTKASIVDQHNNRGLEAPSQMIKSLICESSDGIIKVNVGSGISDEFRISWLNRSIVGKIVEVEYFDICQDTRNNRYSLFLPAFSRVREDKNEANSSKEIASITKFNLI